jgi:3-methyladenine DNA glycosylase AlkC
MADKLKHYFDEKLIRAIAKDLQRARPAFDVRAFVAECVSGLGRLELVARAAHIAEVMHRHLPEPYPRALAVLMKSLGPELEHADSFGMAPFRYLPYTQFVARYGLDHLEPSLRAQYELTKRFSAEGSIRAFLIKHPDATYARLLEWSKDPNVHVRRLVSEGTRPRLPWAQRLPAFQRDPRPVLRLLELLKDDPERYVQRSVANNLNDISKDHPDVAVAVCRRWSKGAPPGRLWIVSHALRSLIKGGDRGALAAVGYAAEPEVRVGGVKIVPRRVKLGSKLAFSFSIASLARREQELLVDFAVHFVKKNGERRPKVFKLKRVILAPGASVELSSRVSFAPMTTRKPLPGRHALDALVNGVRFPLGEFSVG